MIKTPSSSDNFAIKECDRISAARGLLKLMKIMGMWQWKREYANEKVFQYYQRLQYIQRFCIHMPITFTYIALMWLEVFLSLDLDQAGDVLYMSFTEAALVVKILNIWHYSIRAMNFINELAYGEHFQLISQEEVVLWQRKQKMFRNIVIMFLTSSVFTVTAASVGVLYGDAYQLPFAYWVPFEWHTNKRNYWIAYVYNVFGIGVTAITNVCMDMIGSYFLFHTSVLYQILGLRLLHLKAAAEKDVVKELRKIFKFHKNVRRMARECETLVSSYALSQIVLSAFILCFCGYRIQKMNILENLSQFYSMLQFLFVMILEIYLPCYFANEITWNSSLLCTQIYSSEWLKFSIPTRKLIYLYMEFVKHPEKIKAGNYFDVGLPIFTKVMNNAYSFFALIMNKCDKIAGARVLLTILRFVGLWPWKIEYKNNNQKQIKSKIQLLQCFIIHVPATLLFCLLMWVEAFTSPDLDEAGNVLYMSLALSVYIVKFLNIRILSKKATSFIQALEYNSLYDLLTPEEVNMWSKNQTSFRNVVIIFTSGSVFSGVFAFVGVLFDNEYRLGFPYWLPFEWRNPERYWYAYSFNVVGILVSCLSNVSLDMLGCYMIFHIGLLYKLLGMRYSSIRSIEEIEAITELRKLFVMHSSIKRMTNECEILISFYVLAQIIFSALIICFCGYRLRNMNIFSELTQFFAMLQFLSVMILEIYLPCHFAHQITMNSGNLINHIYDCEWLQFSIDNRKFLRLYMEFFKKPVHLRAGNFFDVGLPIFTKVMNNAYSYFALLLNIDK
ncbi:putative odorant receptor 94a [Lucilia cuprina]|uniref:Putative odorant receptor 94a n=1 Tax=Lucilia cuprina TaxID=7375 RepID=A0A0L0CLH6_LUCCU|nr:putative odorant receptor 94a [Lucilia cuprina]